MTDREKQAEEGAPCGGHEINWSTIREDADGDETYIDAECIHCGTSCCIGTVGSLNKEASWEEEEGVPQS